MINCQVFAECRALTEFARGLVYEGSMIEWWARSLNEEMFGPLVQTLARSVVEQIQNSRTPICTIFKSMKKPICTNI
jgi:hypothetical protein